MGAWKHEINEKSPGMVLFKKKQMELLNVAEQEEEL